MSDKALAQVARALGAALIHLARERDPETKKRIASLHTELCTLYRLDLHEQQEQQNATPGDTTDGSLGLR